MASQGELELAITLVSWSIYGVAHKWSHHQETPQEELAAAAAKLIRSGTGALLLPA
ncbi:hypothetical protein SAMN04487969_1267 [Paenibacillus algorifonticola]|uniref:Uncharacterized protein n=1 Tax=Paenibacillus algorifonticola TaxID=684063 RepID=A0A1I2HUH7_9BACL|nr:hypothetical protein [Paenibacillus algorifonticola]SFF32376.1 hypothetical protein SAMN04487969_1267 [Paenibacillus algorifonticola]